MPQRQVGVSACQIGRFPRFDEFQCEGRRQAGFTPDWQRADLGRGNSMRSRGSTTTCSLISD